MRANRKINILPVVIGMLLAVTAFSCSNELEEAAEVLPAPEEEESTGSTGDVPEGYFVADFTTGWGETKAAITGADLRIRNLRYVIYDSAGTFVKEKVVLSTSGYTVWPLAAVKDTLPKGSYTAVFLGNVEKNLFPVATSGGTVYADVLTNFQGQMTDARIVLPNAPFTDTSEYYWSKVAFSDTNPNPYVLLQRVVGMLNLHRNFVDAQTALNKLTNNIVTQIGYKNIIQNQVNNLLPDLLKPALNQPGIGTLLLTLVGGLDNAVNAFANVLLIPVTNVLYDILLQQLVNQIGLVLTGNANQQGALSGLGALLNPWNNATAGNAIVTIRNFPKTMDMNLTVKDYYTGDHLFQYGFTSASSYDEKDILIRGLNGVFDVRKIQVSSNTLVSGLLVDNVVDGSLLLNGTFVNITDPIQASVPSNKRYKSNYSFLDLGLKSYTTQTDGAHSLSLSVRIGDIANIDDILTDIPVLGPLLNTTLKVVLAPVKNITVTVPVNLPLLGVDNLSLSGGWSTPATY